VRDARCARSGTRLTCALGTIARNNSTTVSFSVALPSSTAPLVITATASSTGLPEATPSNNNLTHTAQLATYPISFASGSMVSRVCSGTALTSCFECETSPSSITQFSGTLHADFSISVDDEPGVTGAWSLAGDTLHIEYSDGVSSLGEIDARSVGGGCFEGVANPTPPYVAVHEICVF